jgi:hypothetical protein
MTHPLRNRLETTMTVVCAIVTIIILTAVGIEMLTGLPVRIAIERWWH